MHNMLKRFLSFLVRIFFGMLEVGFFGVWKRMLSRGLRIAFILVDLLMFVGFVILELVPKMGVQTSQTQSSVNCLDDSVGGEAFVAYSSSVMFPVPNAPPTWPLRFQAFVNAGALMPLDQSRPLSSVTDVGREFWTNILGIVETSFCWSRIRCCLSYSYWQSRIEFRSSCDCETG